MIVLIVILVALIAVALWGAGAYNALVRRRQEVRNAWSQIDVQLKRRHDLIPNLVESVKGYMAHERETLEKVIQARNQAVNAKGLKDVAAAENFLSQTLRSLFAVSERYPDLKANQNVLQLQEELRSTENRIAYARQFYNEQVERLNTAVQSVPTNIIAGMTGFRAEDFFEIDEPNEREAPKVQF